MKTEIFADRAAFEERTDKGVNGVTQAFADAHPEWAKERNNEGCWSCLDCSHCSYCSCCSHCSYCSYCSHCLSCLDCLDCSDCWRCSGCSDLTDHKPRPRKASGGEG